MSQSVLVNHRLPGEDAVQFRNRRRHFNAAIKRHLQRGTPAEGYAPGPHRSHQPHEVTEAGMVLNEHGVPTPHTWRVTHPGTLYKKEST